MVLTNHPLKRVLAEPNILGRMVKWVVELSEYGIEYHPRPAIKAQALVDFVVEMTAEEGEHKEQWWKLFVDGSSTLQGSGAGVTLETPQGDKIQYALRFSFDASNNEAEYEALLAGGRLAQAAGAKYLRAYSDSQLVVNQVNGDYETKVQNRKITLLTQEYLGIEDPANEILVTTSKPCWKDTIEAYLTMGSLPADRKEARTIRTRATRFTMIRGELYKRGFSQPYLKCLDPERAEYVLNEIHEESCGNHSGGRSLAGKILRQGKEFKRWWLELKIKQYFTSVGTPQSNEQNNTAPSKNRLDQPKGNWVDELPGVLWAHRTTSRRSTGESPFNLVYGMEAIIPAEIGEGTLQIQQYEPEINDIGRRVNLDLLGEVKDTASIRVEAYKRQMAKAYNAQVRQKNFQIGDLVWRRSDVHGNIGKLDAKWEGPYRVIEAIGNATYKLEKPDGKEIPRTWNASNLKKFYA
ncbi:UNVERIFIED_CONTAM: hypothetical protein Sradi_6900600 [Sesamum radiatum]|uniref:RNase H type-1 domain-containing protein n=1 Tax=Sesamum radiatum TaxID=300843 RepID=A0AAW2JI86_SESRA